MKTLILSILGLFFVSSVTFAGQVKFEIITHDSGYIERKTADSVNSAVIYNQTGLVEFLKEYSVNLNLPNGFFKNKIIIIGFSDTAVGVEADGFKRQEGKDNPNFYLDLHDLRIKYLRLNPKEGMKYTAYCAIGVDNNLIIADVQIRERVSGLCQQYGRNK